MLRDAELVHDEDTVNRAVRRLAIDITAKLGDSLPLVMPVMGGAVVFTGQLLPLLRFPLEFEYLHVTPLRRQDTGRRDSLEGEAARRLPRSYGAGSRRYSR